MQNISSLLGTKNFASFLIFYIFGLINVYNKYEETYKNKKLLNYFYLNKLTFINIINHLNIPFIFS